MKPLDFTMFSLQIWLLRVPILPSLKLCWQSCSVFAGDFGVGRCVNLTANLQSLLVTINHFLFTWCYYLSELFLMLFLLLLLLLLFPHEGYLTMSSWVSFQEDNSCGASIETKYLNNLFITSIQCIYSSSIEEVKVSQRGCAACP